jgi:hypothetical protein
MDKAPVKPCPTIKYVCLKERGIGEGEAETQSSAKQFTVRIHFFSKELQLKIQEATSCFLLKGISSSVFILRVTLDFLDLDKLAQLNLDPDPDLHDWCVV